MTDVLGMLHSGVALSPPHEITRVQVMGAGLLAGALLLIRVFRFTTTVAHEGGHALLGAFFGVPLKGITLDPRGGGATHFKHGPRGFSDVTTTLAGYLGPPAFGLLAAFLLARNHPEAVLWIGLVLLALFLLLARNLRAAVAALVLGAIVVGVLRSDRAGLHAFAALTWTWILLVGAVVDVVVLRAARRSFRSQGVKDTSSDVYQLRRATWIPAGVWVLLFLVGSVAALLYGASLLLGV